MVCMKRRYSFFNGIIHNCRFPDNNGFFFQEARAHIPFFRQGSPGRENGMLCGPLILSKLPFHRRYVFLHIFYISFDMNPYSHQFCTNDHTVAGWHRYGKPFFKSTKFFVLVAVVHRQCYAGSVRKPQIPELNC